MANKKPTKKTAGKKPVKKSAVPKSAAKKSPAKKTTTKTAKSRATAKKTAAKKPSGKAYTNEEALRFHEDGKPGKLQVSATKPLFTQSDLALAYSPGVAAPCVEISRDKENAYKYTARGNMVAVISNGTAVLGLGNLGALASKPVMEGKAVLFKRFADIDSIDIEVDTEDPDEFVNCVRYLGPSWGGINLEDIKAPECFMIESRLKEVMNIPIFHDDQHGTAIITAAGLINAAHLTGRRLEDIKLVVLGAGSAGIACLELVKAMGLKNAILVDRTGVIYEGREKSMNQWKAAHAADTKARTLADAMKGADAFYGLAGPGTVSKAMVKSMAKNPIIFAMANPTPEILPEEIREVRKDAIIATGRSDYPNQVNNVLGFPYIFRGALDVHATTINEEMKIAAAGALAELARKPVPDEVASAYGGKKMDFGPDYIIPVPFDPRLISTIPPAVAQAAMITSVARKPIDDMDKYKHDLSARLNPTANTLNLIYKRLRANPKTVVFAEGEEESVIRAAFQWRDSGYGKAILVGREKPVNEVIKSLGVRDMRDVEIRNAAITDQNDRYIKFMYEKLQRKGYLYRDCVRLVKNDRNTFAASILACGDADTLITGLTRGYNESLRAILNIIDHKAEERVFGLSIAIAKNRQTVFMADTSVHIYPSPEELANIAIHSARVARSMGHEPRVAMLSFSNFGNSRHTKTDRIKEAVRLLDDMGVDFEYDGEITVDVALNKELQERYYPFCRLSDEANVLVMPGLHTAHIASKLLQELGGGTLIGPILLGLEKSAQIVPMNSGVSNILNIAALAATETVKEVEE